MPDIGDGALAAPAAETSACSWQRCGEHVSLRSIAAERAAAGAWQASHDEIGSLVLTHGIAGHDTAQRRRAAGRVHRVGAAAAHHALRRWQGAGGDPRLALTSALRRACT
eukprot:TRINITY_DN8058_c0_g1_i2.p1 TRINITY_DN8058_c0_g1~~TRINITY_DN8058_c0_g1_i2.p1  ORF type:complete len:126 (+),score=19.08 TRINITY_DN8058_c0_g1_i2:50-379(+)